MKMSQYNWNWWFVISCIILCSGLFMSFTITSADDKNSYITLILLLIGSISIIPCLYIGMKPEK